MTEPDNDDDNMNKKPISISLYDSEWMQLLDGQADDSELPACCANVSALRDIFFQIVREGRDSELTDWTVKDLKKRIKWVADGHEIGPLLQKVCAQIGCDTGQAKHERA